MLSRTLTAVLLGFLALESPFADLDYEAALAKSVSDKKLLLVDFTASWCPPCKKMEKETWPHADVRTWLGQHALAIQVDVDEERALARTFQIQAMPTVVALRDGKEFDRIVGYRDAAGLLAWTNDVLAGKRSTDELAARAAALKDSDDVQSRYDLARDLVQAKQYDEALAHYLWLWPASRDSAGMGGVRVSFMLSNMATLARKHAPARKAFLEVLDETQAKIDQTVVPAYEDWKDWSSLCKYFDQNARVVAWYERRRDEQGRLLVGQDDEFLSGHIVGEVYDVLIHSKRPLDAVRLYEDALERADKIVSDYQRQGEHNATLDEEMRKNVGAFGRQKLAGDLSNLYAALLVAERGEEAGEVAALLIRTLDGPDCRLALVRAGLDAVERPLEAFTRWLDEAEAAGGNVRTLRKKLAKLVEASAATGGGK